MFPQLNSLLESNVKNLPNGKSLVIRDSQTDASFLLHHFVSLYIQGGGKVVLLAFTQSLNHYISVGQKLGINLNSACDSKTFVFISGLKFVLDGIIDSNTPNPMIDTSNRKSLRRLYETINSALSGDDGPPIPTLLIIDDVNGCMVSLVHNDSDVEDRSSKLLSKWLQCSSDIILDLEGLSSGRSKDVHGQLKVVFTGRDQSDLHSLSPISRCVHYRVHDKGVSFFAMGTSPAIL